jgi:minor extracellular serine protease Vpr
MKLKIALFCLFIANKGFSQIDGFDPSYKYNASLKLFLANAQKDKRFTEIRNSIPYIPVFIEITGDSTKLVVLKEAGVEIRTVAGNILTADIPLDRLKEIASNSFIKKLELPLLLSKSNDSLMKKYTTVDRVSAGETPLTLPYTGKGVMIGIIDDGIEFGHPYFLDSSGKTMIHAIWNMDYTLHPPPGYIYGSLWTKDSLDYFIANNYNKGWIYAWQNKFGYSGHGTAVASLAAGKYGVAPGATLVGVALTAFLDTLLRSDRIIDGIAFLYNTAQELNKKCIINISLGTQWGGPHDGRTMVEKAIDNFSAGKPDLLICVSAGNDGNSAKHWSAIPVKPDSSYGITRFSIDGSLYFSIPRQFSSTLKISMTDTRSPDVNAPVLRRDSILYQTPFLTIDSIVLNSTPLVFNSYQRNGLKSASFSFTGAHANDDYDEVIVTLKEFTSTPSQQFDYHLSRFIFKGAGSVHGYYPFWNVHPLFYNPFPADSTFSQPDSEFSTGIPGNAHTVLTSGAYNIRNCYVNQRLKQIVTSYQPCQLTYFTSKGPTFDGRIKPDVISPGENVLAANSRWITYYNHFFILDSATQMFGGTSAASPITAGVAALVWEKNPTFTRDSVINSIRRNTYSDSYTGITPNNRAGWGKVDAFKALTGISTNLTILCNQIEICDLHLPPPPPPPPPVPAMEISVRLFPNPFFGNLTIQYASIDPVNLSFFNVVGQEVYFQKLSPSLDLKTTSINLGFLPKGIYLARCTAGKLLGSTVLILIK